MKTDKNKNRPPREEMESTASRIKKKVKDSKYNYKSHKFWEDNDADTEESFRLRKISHEEEE